MTQAELDRLVAQIGEEILARVPANSARTSGTQKGLMQTLAKLYWRASRQTLTTSARVASALRMV